ncbi:MAG: hypothetical protein ACRETA_06120 [Gammaproteobacteria bacterium]
MLAFPAFRRFSASLIRLLTVLNEDGGRVWLWTTAAPDEADLNANFIYEMDEYVTVATYDKTTDAHISLGRLAAEGIQALLFDDNMVQMDWLYSIALGGIKLRVTRVNESAARRVLATDYSHDLDDVDVGKPES